MIIDPLWKSLLLNVVMAILWLGPAAWLIWRFRRGRQITWKAIGGLAAYAVILAMVTSHVRIGVDRESVVSTYEQRAWEQNRVDPVSAETLAEKRRTRERERERRYYRQEREDLEAARAESREFYKSISKE